MPRWTAILGRLFGLPAVLFLLSSGPALAQRAVPVRQAVEPVNADVQVSFSSSVINAGSHLLYTVPADARLVIDTVSVWSFTTSCSFLLIPQLTTTAGGEFSEFRFNTPSRTFHSGGFYTHHLTTPVGIHADPGSDVSIGLLRTDNGCSATIRVSISGQLVPVE